jgi:dTDP-D-glucose 4,6-dehydratase
MTILVTGGAGFIGANFVLDWLAQSDEPVINPDKLTYAGNLDNLNSLASDAGHIFVHGDYAPSHERCIRRNAPALGIDWPINDPPVLLAKDVQAALLSHAEVFS